ncbi:hybrid sensor histidine kinase/response regulator [Maribacter sp. TH_r10]|uniref:hybrid sensor histidine kinase/response regulator n=1 Tax=Maribacter sp. TH_r10 TaxID=3082086 RepID=UPI002954F29F|nr:hybrid sensor histidine kinase/response regulator [Maribacter sp. TH_r10]MDV7138339.1 hybrid sensor histidine kinase/response regulator [Maribacter sp. TH_r10]
MKKPLIAAVDDELMNIELIGFVISSMDYGFLGIRESEKAIPLLEEKKPDLILLDVQMPKLDGFELCENLKSHHVLKEVPIIFLTGLNQTENKIKGLQLGGVDYITKPFNKQELIARIRTHVSLVKAKQKIELQSQKLEQDLVIKNRLFSIIGHDLRSPLSAIKMQLDFILRGIIDPSDKKFVDSTIHNLANTTDEAFNLLDNLLNWAKSESGVLSIIDEKINLKEIVEQNERLIKMALDDKQIAFNIEVPEDAFIMADLNMLKTILRNLLSNALKFTPKKGTITIAATQNKSKWSISVTDSGTGMSPEELEKIMDKNAHFSKEGTEQEAGTGLGLVLCQDFIQKNGGKLSVESTLGIGSRFAFDMPMAN